MRIRRPVLVCFVFALLAGCGKKTEAELPTLHPVSGTVTLKGSPVTEGALNVRADPDNPNVLIVADLDATGNFTLSTLSSQDRSGKKQPGAPEGTYRVTYSNQGEDQRPSIDLKQRFRVVAGTTNVWKVELLEAE